MKVIKTNKYTVVLYTCVIEYFDKEYEYMLGFFSNNYTSFLRYSRYCFYKVENTILIKQ